MKTAKQMERYFKGAANHWRIEILRQISKSQNLTLDQITGKLGANPKTISGHTQRLVQAGLLNKKYQGTHVLHSLSPYGKKFLDFIQTF